MLSPTDLGLNPNSVGGLWEGGYRSSPKELTVQKFEGAMETDTKHREKQGARCLQVPRGIGGQFYKGQRWPGMGSLRR